MIPLIPIKTAGKFSLPSLGIGTYGMGGLNNHDPYNDDERDIQSIRNALNLGITHIDTAESYADGYAEILVGRAVKNTDKNVFITTKVSRRNLKHDDLIKSAKDSLKRLGIEKIDLYLIHAYSKDVPLKESMSAMDYLLENGLVCNLGVSNFNAKSVEEAQSHTKYRIVNNQIHYNVSARRYEEDGTVQYCERNKILVTAYRQIGYSGVPEDGIKILSALASKYGKTPAQIVLNWAVHKPNISVLIKASKKEHLMENVDIFSWRLKEKDEKYIDDNFPRGETINTPPA